MRESLGWVTLAGVAAASVLAAALGLPPAQAEEVPDLALIGARARAMGGAYTAIANGVDAVGWNPAGLVTIERPTIGADSRLSFGSGVVTHPLDTFFADVFGNVPVLDFRDSPGTRFTYYFIQVAAPLPASGRLDSLGLVAAAGYRRVIDLFFRQEQLLEFDPGGGFIIPIEHIDDSEGGVDAFSLSLAGRAWPQLALGMNLNFLTGTVVEADLVRVAFGGAEVFATERLARHDVDGISVEFGARLDVLPEKLPNVTVGAVLRPGYDVDFKGGRGRFRQFIPPGGPLPPADILVEERIADFTRSVPTFYGVGMAGEPRPGLLVSAEFQYRPWNESQVTIHDLSGSDIEVDPGLYEAHSWHLGGEYTFYRDGNVKVPLRLGFRTRPTPLANADSLSAEVGDNGFRTFRGDRVEGHTWSGGVGVHFPTVAFDVALDRTSLTFAEFSEYFAVPPLPGEPLRIIEIEEKITNLYFSSTLRF